MEHLGGFPRREDRMIASVVREHAAFVWALIVALVALGWLVSYGMGGSQSVAPHLLYVPILVGAFRFGPLGALAVACASGVAVGPLLPLDVEEGIAQSASGWIGRTVAFVLVGQVTAGLSSRSLPLVVQRLEDHGDHVRLVAAAANGEFVPVFQPIVGLGDGRIEGVEALARWRRAGGELIGPGEFIGIAERTGAVADIDRAILRQSCERLGEWRRDGVVDEHFHISVNLSARQLEDPALARDIGEILSSAGARPDDVVLEITETALVGDPVAARSRVVELKQLGVQVALDDLGTGESSVAALARLPIDVVKIDRSFVAAMLDSARGRTVVEGVLRLGESLSTSPPIAEGIETAAQREALVGLGCRRGQGFLFARPMAPADLIPLLRSGSCRREG